MTQRPWMRWMMVGLWMGAVGCGADSGDDSTDGLSETGGYPGTGGSVTGVGGLSATGGTATSGGTPGVGGGVASGGTATGGVGSGGESTGGTATGGASDGGTGGTDTGGTSTGGTASGGSSSGGSSSGGSSSGGASTGGAPTCADNTGNKSDGDANIDLDTEYQNISGFGGINVPGWIADLTSAQADKAFGNGPGQIGMSVLRVRISPNSNDFSKELPTAKKAVSYGAKVFATPWTPPASMKTNNNTVGGELSPGSYGAYADHLVSFRNYMETNGVPLYAISVQNEPDISVTYESCDWTGAQFVSFLKAQGSKFGNTNVIAAESFHFNHALTDPILNDSAAAAQVDIIGGHIYGSGLTDYPLARSKGKEVWMTEHYTESKNDANAWPLALNVGKEINDVMSANMSAYVWWYIRRSYGLLTEDGNVSKRGYLMAQYSKFVRPGFVRVGATKPSNQNVFVTAYKKDAQVVVVAVNMNASAQNVALDVYNGCVGSFTRYTTSGSKNVQNDGTVTVANGKASVTLDAQSVTTFVSQ